MKEGQPNLQFGAPPYTPAFWMVIALTGIGAGLAGGLLLRLLHWIEVEAWPYYQSHPNFLDAAAQAGAGRRLILLALAALLAGLVRRLLSHRKVRAHAGDVVEAIWLGSGIIEPVRTFANAVLSIVVVGLGAALGREGAVKHVGAAIASQLSLWRSLPADHRRLAVACGAGAGMAAAYNVPFGGALFAMEVLLGTLALPAVVPALLASLIGCATSWLLLHNQPVYPLVIDRFALPEVIWAIAAGPLLGVAAAGFIRAIGWADRQHYLGWRAFAAPLAALLALGLLSVPFPEVLGNGKDVVAGVFDHRFPLRLLLLLPLLRCLASAGCLAGGVPGGLFTPTLACGALLSGLGARVAASWCSALDTTTCAVAGAGAFLAAATEGPISSTVLLLELTHNAQGALVPMILAVTGATLTTRALEPRSIYSVRIHVQPSGRVVAS